MSHSPADGLGRHGLPRPLFDLFGQVAIRRRLAIGNLAEQIPDEAAKITALRCQRQRHDSWHTAGKIIIQPARSLAQDRRLFVPHHFALQRTITILLPVKPGPDQRRVTGRQNHRPQRRFIYHLIVHHKSPLSILLIRARHCPS